MTTTAVLLASGVVAAWLVLTLRWSGQVRRGVLDARSRLNWAYVGGLGALLVASTGAMLEVLVAWPDDLWVVFVAAAVMLPTGLALGASNRLRPSGHIVLAHTIVIVGLMLMVGAIYVVTVIGLGRVPEGQERTVLLLSMAAAGVAALLAVPARRRLEEFAERHVDGLGRTPDDALKTFASRMTRAVPMDELLLQLAESLQSAMSLTSAEIWTGTAGTLIRTTSVPARPADRIELTNEELVVVARSRVQGNSWIDVWLPTLLDGRPSNARIAAAAHLGDLLGVIVVERPLGGDQFDEEEERVLHELARQLGLALHNVRLDSALQASLEELELRNTELQASRLRIVTAADESRRQIERNLHDGAQQHLVALAVKVGLVKTLLESDPDTATHMMNQLRGDVQAALDELRELAHGIYPPLLRDRGLGEALLNAANRSPLSTTVSADGVQRHDTDIEAAVYFCCLEAMQNAGKYAGEGAKLCVEVGTDHNGVLWFEVRDDGAGFDPATADHGDGFVNMRDRLGAFGGTLEVTSSPGAGAAVRGVVPIGVGDQAAHDPGNVDAGT